MDDVLEQARNLLEEEEITPSEAWLRHWSSTVCSRLCLRLHEQRLPDMLFRSRLMRLLSFIGGISMRAFHRRATAAFPLIMLRIF